MSPVNLSAVAELCRRVDTLLDPWALLMAPAMELSRQAGWRGMALPPLVGGSVVGLTLNSIELGLLFVALMVPFATFFYWVISNLRRLRRTAHEINNTLQVMIGRDPVAMKRIQDAHRERLNRGRGPR